MATFLEDPRLRQRWNQISHTTEAVTENAAAGIWSFGHNYVTPCLTSVGNFLDDCCATPCFGDREERARRRRERERARARRSGSGRAEYMFDFYDDWDYMGGDEADISGVGFGGPAKRGTSGSAGFGGGGSGSGGGGGSIWGSWASEDWDRLLAGSGSRRHGGYGTTEGSGGVAAAVTDQPRRKRGMSYGTRANTATAAEVAARRRLSKAAAAARDDPTVIPSTAPLGFLGRLPWKIGGTLRYKPSAADLQEHPGMRGNNRRRQRPRTAETQDGTEPGALGTHDEHEPLLGHSSDEYEEGEEHGNHYHHVTPRPRRRPDNIERHDYSETPPDYATATSRAAGGHAGKRPSSTSRKRSGTTGSGDTSDSYRSRNDLFPSDGEGDEDAVPLDDEFADALGGHNMSGSRILDDHGSTKTRSSSATKGKRPAGGDAAAHANTYVYSSPVSSKGMSRSASRTTIASSNGSIGGQYGSAGASAGEGHMSTVSIPEMKEQQHKRPSSRNPSIPSLEDLAFEEEQARQEEDAEIERKREAARRVAEERGLLVVDSHVTNPATAAAVADAAAVTPPAKALAPESEHGHDEMVKAVAAEPERDYKGTADIKEERPPDNDEQLSREIALRPDPAGEPELRGPDERAPSSPAEIKEQDLSPAEDVDDEFVPARLPHFR